MIDEADRDGNGDGEVIEEDFFCIMKRRLLPQAAYFPGVCAPCLQTQNLEEINWRLWFPSAVAALALFRWCLVVVAKPIVDPGEPRHSLGSTIPNNSTP